VRAAEESVTLSRFEQDLRMAQRARGTIQIYSGSLRRFEEFVGVDLGEASQEAIRWW